MIVVLDTNIWKSSLYLKNGAAAAMRFYLHQKKAKVGLPEVIRLEVERHLRTDLYEIRDRIRANHQRLLGMVGNLSELILPNDAQLDGIVSNFISDLKFELVATPLTLEAARFSFLRTIDKLPPSQNSQQFKDGVIWHDCLVLARSDDVTLVTGDKAFYEEGDIGKGPARQLVADAAKLPHRLNLVGSLGMLMVDIVEPVDISDELLVSAVNLRLGQDIADMLDRQGLSRAGGAVVTRTFYATETPNKLFAEFRIEFPCIDVTPARRANALLTVAGDGQYDSRTHDFLDITPTNLTITYKTANGTDERASHVYLRGEAFLGVRTIYHRIKEPL